jgi:hypothetical protein
LSGIVTGKNFFGEKIAQLQKKKLLNDAVDQNSALMIFRSVQNKNTIDETNLENDFFYFCSPEICSS